ncbi:MAG: DUF389 domain-containing protein [Chitinophagaceae bacterium]|nr:DUF389 domain-containing protein [Chitinophagaceae bacterium]
MRLFRSRFFRYIIYKLRLPNDEENIRVTTENIHSGSVLTGVNLWVLVAAIFIASLGLNTNSTAVIIGAMLISPLMGPIMGFGLGLGTNDFHLVKKALRNFITMVIISVATSTIYFFISPVKEAGSELLGRTSPTLYDVMIAFFGGVAGIIAGASKLRRGNVVPGVAIATALMPPLCTMGYAISSFNWYYALGAFYLFMINSVFIGIATYLVVTLLGYPSVEDNTDNQRRLKWIIPVIIVLMIAPSIYLTYHIVKKYFYKQSAESFIDKEMNTSDYLVVTSQFEYKPGNSRLEVVTVGDAIDSTEFEALRVKMKKYGLDHCKLILHQGPDSRAAAKGMFEELNSDLKLSQGSINDMYLKMDSLQRQLAKIAVPDSLQADIARKIRTTDTTLIRVSVNHVLSFNPEKNGNDTLWRVLFGFKRPITYQRENQLKDWLMTRLKSKNVIVLTE